MCFTITITNLKTKSDAIIRFQSPEQTDRFLKQLERDVYLTANKHIRQESPPCQEIISQHVIYTSLGDLERVVVQQCKK